MKKGEKMSDELKLKLSLAKKGRMFTEEHRKNLSLSHKGKTPTNLEQLRTYRKGKPLSEEHKRKIGLRHKGKVISQEQRLKLSIAGKGRVAWNKGLKQEYNYNCNVCNNSFVSTKKFRKFCSVKCSSTQNSGENNYRYLKDRTLVKLDKERGGPLHKEWSKKVKSRDGYKCKICGKKEKIVAHHILRWSQYVELRYKITNGISLCKEHHPTTRKSEDEQVDYFKSLIS